MLESLRVRPRICQRIRSGPLGQWVDGFVDVLTTRGYATSVIRRHVRAAAISAGGSSGSGSQPPRSTRRWSPASSAGCLGGGHRSVGTARFRRWRVAFDYWPRISGLGV